MTVTLPRHTMRPPAELCPAHRLIWLKWRDYTYDPRNPREWGGGHIIDSRTSHADRAATWDRKTREEMALTAELCLSGRSPQCDRPAPAPDVEPVGPVHALILTPSRKYPHLVYGACECGGWRSSGAARAASVNRWFERDHAGTPADPWAGLLDAAGVAE